MSENHFSMKHGYGNEFMNGKRNERSLFLLRILKSIGGVVFCCFLIEYRLYSYKRLK
jgi:hypothetical protein